MEFRTEAVDDVEYLIGDDGEGNIHQIDLRAIGSWGLLLGLSDPAEIVAAILRHQEVPVGPGQPNMWTPLYDALGDGLDAMSAAGVPPEHMEDLLDPALGSPVPGPEVCGKLEEARARGRQKVAESPEPYGDVSAAVTEALAGHCEKITEDRLAFVDKLAPVYEIPPESVPEPVPEILNLLTFRTEPIIPGILA